MSQEDTDRKADLASAAAVALTGILLATAATSYFKTEPEPAPPPTPVIVIPETPKKAKPNCPDNRCPNFGQASCSIHGR
jgi:hypothetical protein